MNTTELRAYQPVEGGNLSIVSVTRQHQVDAPRKSIQPPKGSEIEQYVVLSTATLDQRQLHCNLVR